MTDPRVATSLQAAFETTVSSDYDADGLGSILSSWMTVNYRSRWGSHRMLDEFLFGRFWYLFDSSQEGRTDPSAPDTRLIATWGTTDSTHRFGDRRTLRRFPLPEVGGLDRGHLIPMSAGAGDYVNLIPQNSRLNRGWSAAGKKWRALERSIVDDVGAFVFVAAYYNDETDIPEGFDYVVVHTNGRQQFHSFSNRA